MADPTPQLPASVHRFVTDPPWLPLTRAVDADARPTERIVFEPGLSGTELRAAEDRFKFAFPPDLRAMLAVALPVSRGFPDWRDGDEDELEAAFDWPAEGICFDVIHGGFWLAQWGSRPLDSDDACDIARERIADAPTLIPVYGHRYLPAEPTQAGNPVFSVSQSDIIYYGGNLADYLDREFMSHGPHAPISATRKIPFWSDLTT